VTVFDQVQLPSRVVSFLTGYVTTLYQMQEKYEKKTQNIYQKTSQVMIQLYMGSQAFIARAPFKTLHGIYAPATRINSNKQI
jgi:hypothetical protein